MSDSPPNQQSPIVRVALRIELNSVADVEYFTTNNYLQANINSEEIIAKVEQEQRIIEFEELKDSAVSRLSRLAVASRLESVAEAADATALATRNNFQEAENNCPDENALLAGKQASKPAVGKFSEYETNVKKSFPEELSNEECRGERQVYDIELTNIVFPYRMDKKGEALTNVESQTVKSCFSQYEKDENDPNAEEFDSKYLQEYLRSDEDEELIEKKEFFCGNPHVETVKGILHLYKEQKVEEEEESKSDLLLILSIPTSFRLNDLLKFIRPYNDVITWVRIFSASARNVYMAAIKFNGQESADRFYRVMNGTPFVSFEPNKCSLAYISKIEFASPDQEGSFAMKDMTELPICPVCLERMDEAVQGIVTIICNHTYHYQCMLENTDTTCPICRYTTVPEDSSNHTCMYCSEEKDVWMCLICGNVGCGRYASRHAVMHYHRTSHVYAINIHTQRVWDYGGDNYVHRQLAAFPDKDNDADKEDFIDEDKLNSITLEFTYLLTSQLDAQRRYFEMQMNELTETTLSRIDKLEKDIDDEQVTKASLESRIKELLNDRTNLEQKLEKQRKAHTTLNKKFNDENTMNKLLLQNSKEYKEKLADIETKYTELLSEKNKEINELKEQLNDLMMHLETQAKIDGLNEEVREDIAGGSINVSAPAEQSNRRRKARGRK